ncbi:uncharacterized protein SPPG_05708 [Spizellomyces punctatus DAOM BR117]|uniref:Uncharacterized protein n=1 Tax=Spizellomyces punctatus (strain DAOM BR117) TaxID=645134 RepID=A0A0L0HEE4_SPIPD|nr:uncharacterized protein SPPG_05708 [Spizellomyces punctatus DAOM BR117]KNC99472.1 hypothetical protein SPPG_05708 [Spizellomyces punctatus DAOM BR117]|eukprot:XP_016607512.1 hypothetical protein SPPG_05708 [Spizellomyces punctatus DAOM BR117]
MSTPGQKKKLQLNVDVDPHHEMIHLPQNNDFPVNVLRYTYLPVKINYAISNLAPCWITIQLPRQASLRLHALQQSYILWHPDEISNRDMFSFINWTSQGYRNSMDPRMSGPPQIVPQTYQPFAIHRFTSPHNPEMNAYWRIGTVLSIPVVRATSLASYKRGSSSVHLIRAPSASEPPSARAAVSFTEGHPPTTLVSPSTSTEGLSPATAVVATPTSTENPSPAAPELNLPPVLTNLYGELDHELFAELYPGEWGF